MSWLAGWLAGSIKSYYLIFAPNFAEGDTSGNYIGTAITIRLLLAGEWRRKEGEKDIAIMAPQNFSPSAAVDAVELSLLLLSYIYIIQILTGLSQVGSLL